MIDTKHHLPNASGILELPPREVAAIKTKLAYCNAWQDERTSDRSVSAMESCIARVHASLESQRRDEAKAVGKKRFDTRRLRYASVPPTTRALVRWVRLYEASNYSPMALCRRCGRVSGTKSPVAAEARHYANRSHSE